MSKLTVRDLFVRFGADTTGFTTGTDKVKKELTSLNTDFFENKRAMSEVSKEQKNLTAAMKSIENEAKKNKQWTAEQTEQYQKLKSELNQVTLQKAQLKTKEQELRGKISASTAELKKQNTALGQTSDKTVKASKSFGQLATAAKALILGYSGKKLTEFLFGSNAQMEQYMVGFETMLGDTAKAQKLMHDLVTFSAKTPLQLPDSTKSAQLLMNYGVAADNVIEKMTQLGNLSLGNAEKMDRISLAYGQMLAKGKVTGEELRQMTEAGVPLLQALAASMGVSTAALQDMISKGQVGIPELDKAIASLTTGSGKFAGMMEAQSKTMNGMLSTLKDNFAAFGREVGEQGFDTIKQSVSDLLDEMNRARETGDLSAIAKEIGGAVGDTVKVLANAIKIGWEFRDVLIAGGTALASFKTITMVTAALDEFKKKQNEVSIGWAALNAVIDTNPYILLASAMIGVTTAAVLMFDETSDVTRQLEASGQAIKSLSADLEDLQNGGLGGSVEGLTELTRLSSEVVPQIEELGNKTNRSAGEQQLLEQYIQDVNTALGYEAFKIDAVSGALSGNTTEINKNIEALQRRARSEAIYENLKKTESALMEAELNTENAKKNMDENPEKESFWGILANRDALIASQEWREAVSKQAELEKIKDKYMDMYQELAEAGGTAVTKVAGSTADAENSVAKGASAAASSTKEAFENIETLYEAGLADQSLYIEKLTELRDQAYKTYTGYLSAGRLTDEEKQAQNEALEEYTKYRKELLSIQEKAEKESVSAAKAYNRKMNALNKKEFSSWLSSTKKQYDKFYTVRAKVADNAYNRRMKQIESELAVEERRINGIISAIDKEIEARRRLKEESNSQKQIDAVQAQLKYAQLDEFSRRELEKQLKTLKEEKEETEWLNAQNDRKAELQEELDHVREVAAARKEAAQERRERIKETLAAEKESMQEAFDYISDNFTSLADLKAAGINNLNDLFLFAAQQEQHSVNDTFSILSNRTLEVGELYADTVNTKIGQTFDYCVDRAKDAIRELNAAIREADRSASNLKRSAKSSSRARTASVTNYNNNARVTVNKNLSDSQVERRILNTLYDPYAYS